MARADGPSTNTVVRVLAFVALMGFLGRGSVGSGDSVALPFGLTGVDLLVLGGLGVAVYGGVRLVGRLTGEEESFETGSRPCRLCGHEVSVTASKCAACNARLLDTEE